MVIFSLNCPSWSLFVKRRCLSTSCNLVVIRLLSLIVNIVQFGRYLLVVVHNPLYNFVFSRLIEAIINCPNRSFLRLSCRNRRLLKLVIFGLVVVTIRFPILVVFTQLSYSSADQFGPFRSTVSIEDYPSWSILHVYTVYLTRKVSSS